MESPVSDYYELAVIMKYSRKEKAENENIIEVFQESDGYSIISLTDQAK